MTTRFPARLVWPGACLALLALALAAGACEPGKHSIPQRTPPTGWTSVDAAGPHADARDGGRDAAAGRDGGIRDAGGRDVPREGGAHDAAPGQGGAHDAAPRDAGARDAAPADAARDASHDRARDGGADHAGRDGAAADGSAMCGQLQISCAPFACDVDAGRCKFYCTNDGDCMPGRLCVLSVGLCGFQEPATCSTSAECASGHCADGVCCDTACAGSCRSCQLPGTVGTCTAVPSGSVDPHGLCSAGEVCGADAGCSSPGACVTDQDCGQLHVCNGGACHSCAATCTNNADCVVHAVCVTSNGCSWCTIPDAGAAP